MREKRGQARRGTGWVSPKHNGLRYIADAINFNMIGRALLGWIKPSNQAQQSVIDALNAGPRPKKSRKSKAA